MSTEYTLRTHNNSAYREKKHLVKCTLTIAFYNNLQMLGLVLASLDVQTMKDFELIIADDGSRDEVVQILHKKLEKHAFPILHLWHEDKGFRKNRMLNHAIVKAQSEYMIFVDQDCILHPEFIREHFEHRKEHAILSGRRMDFTASIAKMLTPLRIRQRFIQRNLWWIIPAISFMKDNNGPKGIYIRWQWLRRLLNRKVRGVVGCNFSVHKNDLIAVNGFDTRYEGPGTGEDSDIEYRLNMNNVETIPFCNAAVQYHIWHRLQKRPSINEQIFAEVQRDKAIVTAHGISQMYPNGFAE